MMREILSRERKAGVIVRNLICGHTEPEPRGGPAPYAEHAWCSTCSHGARAKGRGNVSLPVLGICDVLVRAVRERTARPCGRPAIYEKSGGRKRCGRHYAVGTR